MIIITGGGQSLALPTEGLQEVPTMGIYSSMRRSIAGRIIATTSQFVTNERAYQLLLTREQMLDLRKFAATVIPPFDLVDSEAFLWTIQAGANTEHIAFSTGAYFSASQRFTGQPQQANGFSCDNRWQMQVMFQVNARGWNGNSVGGTSGMVQPTQQPAGAINGVNTVFTVDYIPLYGYLYRNGILIVDWTLVGSTITIGSGNIPQTGDSLNFIGVL